MSEQLAPQTDATVENSDKTQDPFAPTDATPAQEPTLGNPVKRRRTAKADSILAAAKDVAFTAVQEIAPDGSIGLIHHVRGEEDRLTTHLFECGLPGYRGWFWFATLSRAPRAKQATICEVGLLPGDDALLAPAWVPWADRVQEGDEDSCESFDEDPDLIDAQDVEDLTADSFDAEDETEAENSEPIDIEIAE